MEIAEIVKIYGPLGIGWVLAAYLGKFVLDRYNADIDSKVKLASALEKLHDLIERRP